MSPHSFGPITIILAEDDPDDQMLILRAAEANAFPGAVRAVSNGEELIAHLHACLDKAPGGAHELPNLILLDLNMPLMDGREALQEIKRHPVLRGIPVVVFTTSTAPEDIAYCYGQGVNAYVAKPARFEDLQHVLRAVKSFWFETAQLPGRY